VLYHLTKLGWTDVVLVERKELTAGSTWHAAGGFHAINTDPAIVRLQSYTIGLYAELEAATGQNVGMHMTGGLNIAGTQARWDALRADIPRHRMLGLDTELIGPSEIKALFPLIDLAGIYGALYDRHEGHVDPSGVTHAYAKAARQNGAEIYRSNRVVELAPTGRGAWRVITEQGEIEAEHVINAAGLWAREVGAMAGVSLPLVPMEHHYLLTDDLPELADIKIELPLILDLDAEIYLRQERSGMLVGVYEQDATAWAVDGTPWAYGETELLPPRLDRLTDALLKGYERYPAVAQAGIKRIVNGPFTFTPDGNPLVGPVPGIPNYWSACGVMAGFAQGGGVGLALAQWMVDGEPALDIFAMDVARFGPFATPAYVLDKARDFYSKRFALTLPNEYSPAARPTTTDNLYDVLKAKNAVFGVSYGMEIPLYFAPADEAPVEYPSLKRSNAFASTGREVAVVRDAVGVFDSSSFAKYEVSGDRAAAALDYLLACKLPQIDRAKVAPLLSSSGRLTGDLVAARLAEDRFMLFGSGYLQAWHGRWFDEHLAGDGVTVRNLSNAFQGLMVAGPRSRAVMEELTGLDLDPELFPFMAAREIRLTGTDAILMRVSLSGELSYEIYAPSNQVVALYERIFDIGRDHGIADFGLHALNAMRLEKGHGIWSKEYSREHTPGDSGLDRFIDWTKPDFVGRAAAFRERDTPSQRKLVQLVVDSVDADAAGYEPILHEGRQVGFVTSGGYGHRVAESIALGYVDREVAAKQAGFEVFILGERRPATIAPRPLYDPDAARARN
jgi:dimethylglycine dehydrogenase